MSRISKQEYGFKCLCCGNMIGWDLTRLKESPLNDEIKENIRLEKSRSDYEDLQKKIALNESARIIANSSCISSSETPYKRYGVKVSRNSNCPCGSSKKYKNCHLNN